MGIVTSNAWLDVGYALQRFLLDHFKIVAILESHCEPWFLQVAVNTVVTIVERCSDPVQRDDHLPRFVKVKRPLADVYFDLLAQAGNKLALLRDVAPPARGGTTRINEFFYVDEETIERWANDLTLKVFVCRKTKDELRAEGKLGTLRYIEWGEQQEYQTRRTAGDEMA